MTDCGDVCAVISVSVSACHNHVHQFRIQLYAPIAPFPPKVVCKAWQSYILGSEKRGVADVRMNGISGSKPKGCMIKTHVKRAPQGVKSTLSDQYDQPILIPKIPPC